jgi:hypothetical protein
MHTAVDEAFPALLEVADLIERGVDPPRLKRRSHAESTELAE